MFRPGLCLSDSRMTIVHILTVGISVLDPYCLPPGAVLLWSVQLHCHWLRLVGLCSPFYFVIKRYEQTFRPGLCLSDSHMTVVHILTVGISLLDPYCLPRVQYFCYQFSCIVTGWDLWDFVPHCYHQFSVLVVGASFSSYVVHEFPWQYFLEYHFLVK